MGASNALNDHLFSALDRLSDPSLEGDALKAEIDRARAVCDVAEQVTANNNTVLKVAQLQAEYGVNIGTKLFSDGGGSK